MVLSSFICPANNLQQNASEEVEALRCRFAETRFDVYFGESHTNRFFDPGSVQLQFILKFLTQIETLGLRSGDDTLHAGQTKGVRSEWHCRVIFL